MSYFFDKSDKKGDVMLEKEQLQQLGFNARKAEIYLTLLQRGSGSAAELATAAGIKRTTAYDILNELCTEQLASLSFRGKKRLYSAEPPGQLQLMMQQQLQKAEAILPGLRALYNSQLHRPRVRYYEGVDGMKRVHEELLKVKTGEYFYFGSMGGFAESSGKRYLEEFVRRRVRKKIWSNAIRIRNQEIDEPYALGKPENYRRVRYLSKPPELQVANLTLFDGKISISAPTMENYAMVIESQQIFNLL
ncbi:MAG: helix-turn-helix domain-containing protein, partial [Victivallales bacterium]|nr:helix-turn-helix domain-containing protein [Victivallales bacterium]